MKRLLILLVLLPAGASGATYYVDCGAAPGGDGSLATPWDAVADVNGASFSAGDSVLFNKGCTFRAQLTIPSSGTAGDVTGWTTGANWTNLPAATQYFGNTSPASTRSASPSGTVGNKSQVYTAPGSGNQTLVELSAKCSRERNSAVTIRVAIYDTSNNLIAQGSAAVNVTLPAAAAWQASHLYSVGDVVYTAATTNFRVTVGGTSGESEPAWGSPTAEVTTRTDGEVTWISDILSSQWQGHLDAASLTPVGGDPGDPVTLTGGTNYRIVATTDAGIAGFQNTSVASGVAGINFNNYTAGFPDPLPAQTNTTVLWATRAGVQGAAASWTIALATNPRRLWLDGTEYPVAASQAAVDSTNRWFWSGGTLTVYATSSL